MKVSPHIYSSQPDDNSSILIEPSFSLGTRAFDLFTKDNFEKYTHLNQDNLDDTDPIAWFSASDQRQCVVDMQEKSGKYVLIKLLRADHESENMDLQYIGFVGYTGSRCFAKAKIC